jgi:indolepyruvate ferredoxin oxidoreductase beta subunit
MWLDSVVKSAVISLDFALEIVDCARLIKGYGDTHRRGTKNFEAIHRDIIVPAIDESRDAAAETRQARDRALSSAESEIITPPQKDGVREVGNVVKPIAWMSK